METKGNFDDVLKEFPYGQHMNDAEEKTYDRRVSTEVEVILLGEPPAVREP